MTATTRISLSENEPSLIYTREAGRWAVAHAGGAGAGADYWLWCALCVAVGGRWQDAAACSPAAHGVAGVLA